MEDKKKTPRHEKMYKNSPKLERNSESGKMGVSKGQKESADTDSGTDGMAEHESHMKDMLHRHSMERMELNHKHEKEHMEMQHAMKTARTAESGQGEATNQGDQ